jgi:hypothetical protein
VGLFPGGEASLSATPDFLNPDFQELLNLFKKGFS